MEYIRASQSYTYASSVSSVISNVRKRMAIQKIDRVTSALLLMGYSKEELKETINKIFGEEIK